MELLAIGLLLPANYLAIKKTKRKLNYLSVFSAIWILMFVCARIRLFNLNETSEEAYNVVGIGALFFAIAYLATLLMVRIRFTIRRHGQNKFISRYSADDLLDLQNKPLVNLTVYLGLFIIILALQLVFLSRAVAILASGDLRAIHRAVRQYDESGIYRSDMEKLLNFVLIQPFLYAMIPVSVIALFGKIRHGKMIFWLTTLLSVTFFFTHAGRIIIMDYIFYLLFCVSFFNVVISKRVKRRIAYIMVAAIVGIVFITASRRGMEYSGDYFRNSFLREIYDYFAIPFPQLSYWMEKIQTKYGHTYGIGFFNGFIELPIRFLHSLGVNIDSYKRLIEAFGDTESIYTHAAYFDKSYNAFVTCFYFFYADFSYLGVALGSFVFGAISGIIEKLCAKRKFIHFCIYLMFLHNVVRIFARWSPYLYHYLLSFVYILLICRRGKSA